MNNLNSVKDKSWKKKKKSSKRSKTNQYSLLEVNCIYLYYIISAVNSNDFAHNKKVHKHHNKKWNIIPKETMHIEEDSNLINSPNNSTLYINQETELAKTESCKVDSKLFMTSFSNKSHILINVDEEEHRNHNIEIAVFPRKVIQENEEYDVNSFRIKTNSFNNYFSEYNIEENFNVEMYLQNKEIALTLLNS